MNPIVHAMIFKSVAPSTSEAYEKVKADVYWNDFLASKYMIDVIPEDEYDPFLDSVSYMEKQAAIILFMHYLDNDLKKSPDNIGKIMSALRFIFRCNLRDMSVFDDESVGAARNGLRKRGRLGSAQNTMVGSTMNVTVDMLEWIRAKVMAFEPLNTKNLMIYISCELSFHFGYRPGEIAISAGNFEHTICNEDVVFECHDGSYFRSIEAKNHKVTEVLVCLIHLNSRKADQSGGGDTHFLTRFTLASERLLLDMFYWAHQNSNEPSHMFFRRQNGKRAYHLRTHEVSNAIKEAAEHFGLPRHLFSAKSCRVGAGTALAAAGVDVTINKRLLGHTSNESNQMYQRASVNTRGALDLPGMLTVTDTRRVVVFKNTEGRKSTKSSKITKVIKNKK